MTLVLNGTTGVSAVDGSASTPAIQGNDSNTGIFFPAADTIAFAEGGAEVARFDASGNLLLNTTTSTTVNPANNKFVAYDAGLGDRIIAKSASAELALGADYLYANTNNALRFGTNNTERARIDSSGNVGIGTSSPVAKLHSAGGVVSTGAAAAAAANASIIDFSGGVSRVWATGADNSTNGVLTFITASANASVYNERARIDSSGNLLVNTTTNPGTAAKFVVSGNSDGSFNPMTVVQEAAGSTSRTSIQFYRNSSAAVVGTITTTNTATAYNTSSDYRLKENIAPMTGALARVTALKPVTYKWKVDGSNGEGFIAHELAEVVPQCVTGEKDAVDENGNPQYQGIDTSFLVATLTAAIQELKAIVDQQAVEIAALKGQA